MVSFDGRSVVGSFGRLRGRFLQLFQELVFGCS
jgi:hypothetical protein